MRRWSLLMLSMLLVLSLASPAAEKITKGKFAAIEVVKFDVREGIQFPPDYQVLLVEDLIKQLENSKKFKQVIRTGENPADAAAPALKLTGTITEYKAGSRAKRYLVGFGAGKTKVVAQVQFVDRTTGSVLLDRKVDGKVIIGVIGGDSRGATNGLAKEVSKVAKDTFF